MNSRAKSIHKPPPLASLTVIPVRVIPVTASQERNLVREQPRVSLRIPRIPKAVHREREANLASLDLKSRGLHKPLRSRQSLSKRVKGRGALESHPSSSPHRSRNRCQAKDSSQDNQGKARPSRTNRGKASQDRVRQGKVSRASQDKKVKLRPTNHRRHPAIRSHLHPRMVSSLSREDRVVAPHYPRSSCLID